MSGMVIATVDITDSADAYKLGYPDRVSTVTAGRAATMTEQNQAIDPPVFHQLPGTAGFKLALERIMQIAGNFGTPGGPSQYGPRMRAVRPEPVGPTTVERTVTRMPVGLVDARPHWESYMFGSDGYMAS